jgi:hypothetical protein
MRLVFVAAKGEEPVSTNINPAGCATAEGALVNLRRHLSAALVVADTAAAYGTMDLALVERVDALYDDVCAQVRALSGHHDARMPLGGTGVS